MVKNVKFAVHEKVSGVLFVLNDGGVVTLLVGWHLTRLKGHTIHDIRVSLIRSVATSAAHYFILIDYIINSL